MVFWRSGSWEVVNSATEMVKKNSPDLTPIKNAWCTTYSVGCNSVRIVKDATYNAGSVAFATIRDNGSQMVMKCIPSPERVEKISPYINHPASKEFVRYFVPDNGSQMVMKCIPSPERVEKISPYVNHPASKEFVRYFFPGATPVLGLAEALLKDKGSGTHSNLKKSDHLEEQLKLIKAENEMLKEELEGKNPECLKLTRTPAITKSTTRASEEPEKIPSHTRKDSPSSLKHYKLRSRL